MLTLAGKHPHKDNTVLCLCDVNEQTVCCSYYNRSIHIYAQYNGSTVLHSGRRGGWQEGFRFSQGSFCVEFACSTSVCVGSLQVLQNGCFCLYVGPVIRWGPVQGVPGLLPNVKHGLVPAPPPPPSRDPQRISSIDNGWMDGWTEYSNRFFWQLCVLICTMSCIIGSSVLSMMQLFSFRMKNYTYTGYSRLHPSIDTGSIC